MNDSRTTWIALSLCLLLSAAACGPGQPEQPPPVPPPQQPESVR